MNGSRSAFEFTWSCFSVRQRLLMSCSMSRLHHETYLVVLIWQYIVLGEDIRLLINRLKFWGFIQFCLVVCDQQSSNKYLWNGTNESWSVPTTLCGTYFKYLIVLTKKIVSTLVDVATKFKKIKQNVGHSV